MDGASRDGLDCDIRGLRDVVFDIYILAGWPRCYVVRNWRSGMPLRQLIRMSTVKDLAELIHVTNFVAVTVRTHHDTFAPLFGQALDVGQFVS